MEFKFRAVNDRPPPYMSPSANLGYFSDLPFRAGYSHNLDYLQNPIDVREAIHLREMEKQRIREEIIAEEIVRRRVLEAEVRRDLMVEREMAILRAVEIGLPYEERFLMQPNSRISFIHHSGNWWSEEQRTGRLGHGGCSHYLLAPPSPQGVPLRLPEPLCDKVKKDKLIMLARPDPNPVGKKRKTPPESGVLTLPSTSLKKPKEEWSCALCQVSATSERGLNAHLRGRKHKAKEEGLRAQRMAKNSNIRSFPKKTRKHSQVAKKSSVSASSKIERIEEKLPEVNKTGNDSYQKMELKNKDPELPLKKNRGAENFENRNKETLRMGPEFKKKNKKKLNYENKFNFWCDMCSIGAHSEKSMDAHMKGRRHRVRVDKLKENCNALPAPVNTSNTITPISQVTQMSKDENMVGTKANKNAKGDIPDADGLCPSSVEK